MHRNYSVVVVSSDLERELVREHPEQHHADCKKVMSLLLSAIGVSIARFGAHVNDGPSVTVGNSIYQFVCHAEIGQLGIAILVDEEILGNGRVDDRGGVRVRVVCMV